MPVDKAVQSLRLFTECFSGIKEKETIAATGVWDAGEVNKRALEQAYAAGKKRLIPPRDTNKERGARFRTPFFYAAVQAKGQ